ncbi:MAG TPA: hypothetical protein VN844_26405 [Pyrinomonadaceae bacterium]|nr:hypothetical protein [Pyrinomonadaceae bacterium]
MFKILAASGTLVIATLFFLGFFSVQNRAKIEELEKSPERGKLVWHSQMAKAKGRQNVLLDSTIVDYAVPRSLETALANYHLVVAEPVSSRSYAATYNVHTWYKFRIVEELSTPNIPCVDCFSLVGPPEDLLPLESNEFLSAQLGGEATVDGISIKSTDASFPNFEIGQRYLLLVAFDENRIIGKLSSGPWGAFVVNSSDSLEPINSRLKHPFRERLSAQFGNSLHSLRAALRTRK